MNFNVEMEMEDLSREREREKNRDGNILKMGDTFKTLAFKALSF